MSSGLQRTNEARISTKSLHLTHGSRHFLDRSKQEILSNTAIKSPSFAHKVMYKRCCVTVVNQCCGKRTAGSMSTTRTELDPTRWGKLASPWRDVSAEDWNSVEWQLRNLVRTPEQLTEQLGISSDEAASLQRLRKQFRFAISPYYFSLID